MQGIVIAGTHSGCGKTTITMGILAALKKKGLRVQSFKAGPDFIDSGLHRLITGRPSRNLDIWMCREDGVVDYFRRYSADADIAVIEGVMGMYDGPTDGKSSTAGLATLLNLPVLLVVDAYGMAESAGAVVKGFVEYKRQSPRATRRGGDTDKGKDKGSPGSEITGIIFNRVASENHYRRLKNSVHEIPVLGYLPRELNFEIPHRHLGLTVAEENPITREDIERLADAVLEHIDVEAIIQNKEHRTKNTDKSKGKDIPTNPSPLTVEDSLRRGEDKGGGENLCSVFCALGSAVRIAVAYDKAFCFYYEDNLDLLRDAGAEIIRFSPISDSGIPDNADAVYIGGGYPELYAGELSLNASMLRSIRGWADSGRPLYAECGGLIYLSQGIHDFNSNFFEMAGVFQFETEMKKTRVHLGYREILLKKDCIMGKKGDKCRGHEFHYSGIKGGMDSAIHSSLYTVKNSSGKNIQDEGYCIKKTLASYIHIHFGSNPHISGNFMNFIKEKQ